jgi:hypothetical protein
MGGALRHIRLPEAIGWRSLVPGFPKETECAQPVSETAVVSFSFGGRACIIIMTIMPDHAQSLAV